MAVKKQWFEIAAPAFFGEKPIAETLAAEAKQIVGRVVSVSLSDLDPQAKKFWLKIDLRISDVQGSKAMTEIIGHDILTEKISRMVQRYSRRVDDIQDVVTTDGAKVRVKSVLTIPGSVGTSIKDAIRAKMHDTVKMKVSNATFEEFLTMVINDQLPQNIRRACRKTYPIGAVEIRKSDILGRGFEPSPMPMPEEPKIVEPASSEGEAVEEAPEEKVAIAA